MAPADPKFRFLYLAWALVEILCFSGLLYGWGAFVYVLKDEGLFLDLCDDQSIISNTTHALVNQTDSQEANCDDREDMLSLIYAVDMFVLSIGVFVIGQLSFKFGTRKARLFTFGFFTSGAVLIAVASKSIPWFIIPGLGFLAVGGYNILALNLQFELLFPHNSAIVHGLLVGAFETSSGMQQLVKLAYKNGISRPMSYSFLALLHLITLVNTFFFLPKIFIKKTTKDVSDITSNNNVIHLNRKNKQNKISPTTSNSGSISKTNDIESPTKLNPWIFIRSSTFISHCIWFIILQFRYRYFISTSNNMLERLFNNDDTDVDYYTNVLSYTLMGGIPASLLFGLLYNACINYYSSHPSLLQRVLMPTVLPQCVTTLLCVLLSLLVLLEKRSLLYASFVMLLLLRSSVNTMGTGFIASLYPPNFFGPMFGLLAMAAAVTGLLQYAFFQWMEHSAVQLDVFWLVISLLTLGHPLSIWLKSNSGRRSSNKDLKTTDKHA